MSYTVTPVTRFASIFDGDLPEETEFRVVEVSASASDLGSPWYTVIVRPGGRGYRFSVWSGSQFAPASGRRKAQLSTHAVTRLAVIEAVKNHLTGQ